MFHRTDWSRNSGNQNIFRSINISVILISNSDHSCSAWDAILWEMFELLAETKSKMTSSNGNIFCVTGPLWGESIGHRWILLKKARPVTRNLDVFFDPHLNKRLSKNRDARDLRRHCNDQNITCDILNIFSNECLCSSFWWGNGLGPAPKPMAFHQFFCLYTGKCLKLTNFVI